MLNIQLMHTDLALGSLRFAASYRVRVGRVLDTHLKRSSSE